MAESKLALLGGTPVRDTQSQPWPRWPVSDEAEESAVLEVLRHGEWGGFPMPNHVAERFTAAFARRHDCRFGQCVANGTVSMEIALIALGVEPGSEVIVPAYTFETTAAAVLFAGCVPVFADVDPDDYCLSPDAVEALVGSRTQAILPVHLAMSIADMDRLSEIAERHQLKVIEDCAHAHGARWRGRGVGSLGDAGSFSFQTSKLMTSGEGGIVVTNDEQAMDRLFALTNCGRPRPGEGELREHAGLVGHNYRMTDLQAAILEVQLGRLDEQHRQRGENAEHLRSRIDEMEGLSNLRSDPRVTERAIYQFVFRYDPEHFGGLERDVFVAGLQAEGIPCDGRFYESLPTSPLLQKDSARYPAWAASKRRPSCPVAERAAYRESVWLPHHLLLGDHGDAEQIAEAIEKICRNAASLSDAVDRDHPAVHQAGLARTSR